MSDVALPEIAEGLVVRPGDTLILRLPAAMSVEQFARFRADVEPMLVEKLPGVEVVFFGGVEQMAVYRPDEGGPG